MSKLKNILKQSKILVSMKNQAVIAYNLLQEKKRKEVYNVKINELKSPDHINTFCGYFDISPFKKNDSNIVLVHANNADPKLDPSGKDLSDIGFYNIAENKFYSVDKTSCWNWQQGSRLQWIDEDRFIFNFHDKNTAKLSSKIYNYNTSETEVLPFPISAAYKSELILTLSFANLTAFSEYGYDANVAGDEQMGVESYSLKTKQLVSLFSLKDIIAILGLSSPSKGHINHLLVRPDGKKFVFIFRYYKKQQRFDTLLSYDFETNTTNVLIENKMVSHFTWKNNSELLIWGIFDKGPGYYLLNCDDRSFTSFSSDKNDGHPTYLKDQSIITDSYPDTYSKQHYLTIISKDFTSRRELLKLNHPVIYTPPCRCDMHPSLSSDQKLFQVDTRHSNSRSVIIGELAL